MRYYDLTITKSDGSTFRRWTSHPNGVSQPPDPGALNVEFDMFVADYAPADSPGASVITIEGVPLQDLFQAQQFVGLGIVLRGGMGKGLPLADPSQSGTLLIGQVFQAFGNWVGTEMTLDLVVIGVDPKSIDKPGNFSFAWPAGTDISQGVGNVLKQVYPKIKQNIATQSGIVFPNTESGSYSTLRQFAAYVQGLTAQYGDKATYPGISIAFQGGEFFIYDGTQTASSKTFKFTDFVGQPTWIAAGTMQVMTVMRADIQIGDTVTMPTGLQGQPGIVTGAYNPSSPQPPQYQSGFKGKFQVSSIRHVGNFRDANGQNWATIFNCVELSGG